MAWGDSQIGNGVTKQAEARDVRQHRGSGHEHIVAAKSLSRSYQQERDLEIGGYWHPRECGLLEHIVAAKSLSRGRQQERDLEVTAPSTPGDVGYWSIL